MEATTPSIGQRPGPTGGEGLAQRAWVLVSATGAALIGLTPHLLHHAGPLAGAALFAGAGGSLLFGALGFLAAIPFLVRLHRRHGNWRFPAAVLALFAAMFSLSTFVIGPAISGGESQVPQGAPAAEQAPPANGSQETAHEAHH